MPKGNDENLVVNVKEIAAQARCIVQQPAQAGGIESPPALCAAALSVAALAPGRVRGRLRSAGGGDRRVARADGGLTVVRRPLHLERGPIDALLTTD